jgi:hypothetical protein
MSFRIKGVFDENFDGEDSPLPADKAEGAADDS